MHASSGGHLSSSELGDAAVRTLPQAEMPLWILILHHLVQSGTLATVNSVTRLNYLTQMPVPGPPAAITISAAPPLLHWTQAKCPSNELRVLIQRRRYYTAHVLVPHELQDLGSKTYYEQGGLHL